MSSEFPPNPYQAPAEFAAEISAMLQSINRLQDFYDQHLYQKPPPSDRLRSIA